MPLERKKTTPLIDSRHLKVLASKRENLKNSIVFICLNKEKFGHVDQSELRSMIEQIDKIEPDGVYFSMLHDMDIEFYERSEFRNRDLVITIKHQNPDEVDTEKLENAICQAIPNARSITFLHQEVEFEGLK